MALYTPLDLTSVILEGWYRIIDPSGALSPGADVYNGSGITNWIDRSGKGRTLFLDGSGHMWVPDAFGTGKPGITTNGNGGWCTAPGMAYSPNVPIGASALMATNSANNQGRFVSLITPNGADPYDSAGVIPICTIDGPSQVSYWYGFTRSTTTIAVGTPVLIDCPPTSLTTAKTVVNGVDGASMSQSHLSTYQMDRLGLMEAGQTGSYTPGLIAEMILWSGVIDPTELSKLRGYYAWNNRRQDLLQTNDPYKMAAPTKASSSAVTKRRSYSTLIMS